jgi:predicted outer membrane lipoprotein
MVQRPPAEVGNLATETSSRAFDPTAVVSIKLAGAAGLLGCALGVVGGLVVDIMDAPATTASAAEIAESVAEDRTPLLVGMLLSTAAVSLWFVFGAGVWLRLRRASDPESLAAPCFAFGFVGLATLLLAGFTAFFVLAYRDADVGDPRLLYDLAFGLLAMSGAPTAIALGSYAALVLRSPALPRWTAWLAVAGALAHVALLASFVVSEGFFSLEGQVITAIPATLFAWIIGTGIAMLATER